MKYDVGLIGPLNVDLLITGQAPTDISALTFWAGPSVGGTDMQVRVRFLPDLQAVRDGQA